MDTSETYILQCQKATEIQDGGEYGGVWLTHLGNDILLDTGTDRLYYVKDTYRTQTCSECGRDDTHIEKSEYTWLPTQDQLQAMYKPALGNTFALFGAFWVWCVKTMKAGELDYCQSWEQLWLAFIMSDFGKRWNGGDWA